MKIGVDIGGSKIRAGLIRKEEVIEKITLNTPKTSKKIIEQVIFAISLLDNSKTSTIGVGAAGIVSDNKIIRCPNLPLKGDLVVKEIKQRFRKNVKIGNDADCFALGESIRTGCMNLVGFTIGTGVGGGIIIDGKIYKGKGSAGELGHCCVDFKGREGYVKGDLEAYISGKAIKKIYKKEADELKSRKAWQEIGRILGIGIADAVHALDPEMAVLGGGVSRSFEKFKSSMKKEIRERKAKAEVLQGDENSGIIGAGNL